MNPARKEDLVLRLALVIDKTDPPRMEARILAHGVVDLVEGRDPQESMQLAVELGILLTRFPRKEPG